MHDQQRIQNYQFGVWNNYVSKELTLPSECEEYDYNEAMCFAAERIERGISTEELLWEESEELKKECKPLFDKLHEIIKPYI